MTLLASPHPRLRLASAVRHPPGMTPQELQTLIASTETDRVEKTRSTQDVDKFREAICSFSNDVAGKGLPGYLLIGVECHKAAWQHGFRRLLGETDGWAAFGSTFVRSPVCGSVT